jgi:hypothetical protein
MLSIQINNLRLQHLPVKLNSKAAILSNPGGVMGEFNQDPTFGKIGVDLILSVIPGIDQIADGRDIIAHLYYMIAQGQYRDPMRWLGLALSLIGLIATIGSVIKSASKVLLKGAKEVLPIQHF